MKLLQLRQSSSQYFRRQARRLSLLKYQLRGFVCEPDYHLSLYHIAIVLRSMIQFFGYR